ncbi:MAG: acetylornithine deacetylase [Alphaproteobacteria bacterium]|nr:acetylornithine deacetylase [Alphaproteobacteria bacterium]
MNGQALTSRELIDRLVAFDTTSRNSNLSLIDFVAEYLAGFGIESRRIFNEDGSKANLFATIGPDIAGGVVLSGHTDVVPVDGQDWHSDPFAVMEQDGRLYGRGTADMKSFIAVALAAVPEFLSRPLTTPVHFAFSYDEEVGCLGVRPMIREIVDKLPLPGVVVVGEPTEMRVATAEKGISGFETTVTGREAHSSAPDTGVNAIMVAARLIEFLERLGRELRERPPVGKGDAEFDPPYTTIGVGIIEGGTALNIIPKTCRFRWEFRPLPGFDPGDVTDRFEAFARREILPAMQRVDPAARIETEALASAPALEPMENSPAEALARALTGANTTAALSFASEAGLFQEAGIPAVVCGPGSIDQAHQPDEFIALDQIAACEDFMTRLAERLRRG